MNADATMARHILVVDDDRLVLASLSRGLRDAGYRVSVAADGENAFKIAVNTAPDLALLDVRMPGMDGIELGRLLHEHTGTPFLYLSAYGQTDIVKRAAGHGALGYLVKPLDIAQILPSIEAALTRAAEIRKLRETETQLNAALAGSRETSMAIGLLMERNRLSREQAFDLLREHARSQRRQVAEVAREMLESAEKLNIHNGVKGIGASRKRKP
ncbi:MAG: response regulator [Betaproteobacteria bacterium]|nr:response regulator [Betaproteobacteria bacterium]